MAVGRGSRGSRGSPVEGQKSLLKGDNGATDDENDEAWTVSYNKGNENGVDRKRQITNGASSRSIQDKIEDLEVDDHGFVDQTPVVKPNRKLFILIVVGVALGVGAIVSVVVFYFRSSYVPNNYIIVVDAGSSHTKLNVFHYRGDKVNGTGKIEQLDFMECNGTVMSFMYDYERMRTSWTPCFQFAKEKVPEDRWDKTEVYFGATAELRQFQTTQPEKAERLLNDVRTFLNETYDLSPDRTHVLILDGSEEGALAWATVNFITKSLLPDNITSSSDRAPQTYGSIDLGGSSTQIAFTTQDPAEANFHLTFFGAQYQLFSKSFRCRGKGEAHRLLKAQLVTQSKNSQFVIHPCYPRGLVTNESHTDIFSAQCTGYLDKEKFVHRPRYQLQGTGDVDQCRAHVRKIFADPTGKCPFQDEDCSFNSQLKPMNISGPFMGFAGLYFVMDFFNLSNGEDRMTSNLTNFREVYRRHCNQPWSNLSSSTNRFMKGYCFDGNYIDVLLTEVYGFSDEEFGKIEFRKSVNGVSTGWAVGLALNSTNAVVAELEIEPFSRAFFLAFLVIFAVFLLLAVSFLCRGVRRSFRDSSI
ncbi:hypothetical protein RvY_01065 [Ramazzottius varieornatus]|uniref:Ectonucleoside triphosphate diphosphohydrolase 1 n=1 Tax=Ramazzottius varieornatus TaxID=947166 RepID=A0A1D1UF06_RAMVA|nr:hypothetical protein RvY_01065 [Ramazzottius varieornatus]